jgi:uncharacterized protein YukJ
LDLRFLIDTENDGLLGRSRYNPTTSRIFASSSGSELLRHPVTTSLPAPGSGWTPLPSRPGGASLDYIRAHLFDPAALRLLPPDAPGPDNDLADLLDHYVRSSRSTIIFRF